MATHTRAHATRRPSRAARSTPCTTGLAAGGGSPTGGSPAPRRPLAGARTRRATSGTSWRSTTRTRIVESRGDIHRFSEKSRAIDYRGSWERAEHPYYRGDRARQAKRKGQTATFRFTGSQVAWNGPNGPTRGKAKVYLDGQYVKTVDLYSRKFDARNRIYTKTFAASGAHTLTIKVMGTRGRPVVSIDEFVVWE